MSVEDWTANAMLHLATIREQNPSDDYGVMESIPKNGTTLIYARGEHYNRITTALSSAGVKVLGTGHDTINDFLAMIVESPDAHAVRKIIDEI